MAHLESSVALPGRASEVFGKGWRDHACPRADGVAHNYLLLSRLRKTGYTFRITIFS